MFKRAIAAYLRRTSFPEFTPKAVLFDMDGVLINSMPNHVVAWSESMARFGVRFTKEDAYMTEGARGVDTIRKMVKLQQNRDISEEEAQRMYDEKTRVFGEQPKPDTADGAYELMEKLSSQGLSVCVVTGSGQRPLIQRLLTDFSPYLTEDRIITAYDVKCGKPAPDPYLAGMKRCGVHPWETVVVENAPLGVQAGNASCAFTIGLNTGPLPSKMLKERGADIVLSSMRLLCDRWNVQELQCSAKKSGWNIRYDEILAFVQDNKRRPSKHNGQERRMHNWLKQAKKRMNKGEMADDKVEKFKILLELCNRYRRLNQFAYASESDAEG
ncbi:MAG: HAD hydrolase-like protein [Prevotella sp.]|nr:HAD hydrolase-like protein [Prevotella sp.]